MDGSDIGVRTLLSKVEKQAPGRLEPIFARHGIEHSQGVKALVTEICADGSNTLATWLLRLGDGVEYSEVVNDVAEKMKVAVQPSILATELAIVGKVMEDFYNNAPPELRAEVDKILEDQRNAARAAGRNWGIGKVVGAAMWSIVFRQLGAVAVRQLVGKLVAMQAGRFAAFFAARRAAALATSAIPFVNVAMAAWTVWDLAGPAYRKTIPTVIEIALLRMEYDEVSAV